MTYVDPLLTERAARIELLAVDVDGVLTDGLLYFDTAGNELKAFNTRDGLGMKAENFDFRCHRWREEIRNRNGRLQHHRRRPHGVRPPGTSGARDRPSQQHQHHVYGGQGGLTDRLHPH